VHRRELNERRALLKILGVCFLLLAAYIAYESALDLWSRRAVMRKNLVGITPQSFGVGIRDAVRPGPTSS